VSCHVKYLLINFPEKNIIPSTRGGPVAASSRLIVVTLLAKFIRSYLANTSNGRGLVVKTIDFHPAIEPAGLIPALTHMSRKFSSKFFNNFF